MAERSIVQILLRASGGRSVATETGQATGGLRRLDRAATGAGRSMRGVASAAGVAGAAMGYGLYRGAKASVMAASDVAESLAKNEVLFGRQAVAVSAFADTSAKSFGIGRSAALQYTGVFGNLFGALGINERQSSKLSVSLTRLAADMASFNNTTPEEALEAIRSGLVGETEPLRKYGVNIQDATLRQEALRQGLISTTKDALNPQQKALAAQALIVRQTDAAHGDFARTSDGLANQQRILSASVDDVSVKFGQALLPSVTNVVRRINSDAIPVLDGLADSIGNVFDRDDLDLSGKLGLAAGELRTAGAPVVDSLIVGLKNAQLDDKLGDAIEWAAPKLADGAARAAPAAAEAFVNSWMDAGPWGKLLGALVVAKSASKALGGFGPWGVGGPLAAGSLRNPIAVVTAGAPGGLPGGKGGKKGVPGGPSWLRRAAPKVAKFGGAASVIGGALALPDAISTEQDLEPGEADIYRRNNQAALERARRRPPTRMPSIEFHGFMPVVVNVDGEPVAKANAKVQGRVRARDRR